METQQANISSYNDAYYIGKSTSRYGKYAAVYLQNVEFVWKYDKRKELVINCHQWC